MGVMRRAGQEQEELGLEPSGKVSVIRDPTRTCDSGAHHHTRSQEKKTHEPGDVRICFLSCIGGLINSDSWTEAALLLVQCRHHAEISAQVGGGLPKRWPAGAKWAEMWCWIDCYDQGAARGPAARAMRFSRARFQTQAGTRGSERLPDLQAGGPPCTGLPGGDASQGPC